ncbi:MAG TPA: phosphatidate cytidylyltransferase [Chthoniobacterales bacterium]
MPGIHPVALWIAAAIAVGLAVIPLMLLLLEKTFKLGDKLQVELWMRYKSWLILAPLLVVPLLAGRLWAILSVGILSLLCYREFARATGLFRHRTISAIVALGIVLLTFAVADNWYDFFVALTSLCVSALVIAALLADEPKGYIQRVGLGVFAFLVFGVCLGHFGYFANEERGQAFLLAIMFCVELNDIFAFCTGKLFGRRKLAPKTSPNKTIAGAVGALILTTALFATLMHFIAAGTRIDRPIHLITLGMLLSFTGQCGDLVMSSVKRDLGIKDLGTLLPGHGGLLDRFDSLIFVGPAVLHYLSYFGGISLETPTRIFTGP